jgi:hypothetical protein
MSTEKSEFDFEMITPEDPAELEVREVALHCHCCGCGYVNDE